MSVTRLVMVLAFSAVIVACRQDATATKSRASSVSADSAQLSPPPSAATAPSAATTPSAPPASPEKPEAPFEGTAGIVERGPSDRGIAVLQAVRVARHEGFDRVVFEFSGKGLPGYHLEYIDEPVRQCGSGKPAPIAGDGWLEVRMAPAAAHDEQGQPTAAPGERKPDLPIVRELELTCDFEAVLTWVLGAASPNRYRVLELTEPPRLAVDVKH